jgi:hypothetical protein
MRGAAECRPLSSVQKSWLLTAVLAGIGGSGDYGKPLLIDGFGESAVLAIPVIPATFVPISCPLRAHSQAAGGSSPTRSCASDQPHLKHRAAPSSSTSPIGLEHLQRRSTRPAAASRRRTSSRPSSVPSSSRWRRLDAVRRHLSPQYLALAYRPTIGVPQRRHRAMSRA